MADRSYEPPRVWTWDKESGGRFAAINRPVAGATHDKALPVGRHPSSTISQASWRSARASSSAAASSS